MNLDSFRSTIDFEDASLSICLTDEGMIIDMLSADGENIDTIGMTYQEWAEFLFESYG